MDQWERHYPKFFKAIVVLVIVVAVVLFLWDAYGDGSLHRVFIRIAKFLAVLVSLYLALHVIVSN